MLVGAAMIAYVEFIEGRTGNDLAIFFWVAILLILYGVGKEAKRFMTKKVEKELAGPPPRKEHVSDHRHPAGHEMHGRSPHESHEHTRPHPHPSHPHEPRQKTCPRCHARSPAHVKFCHHCGWRYQ